MNNKPHILLSPPNINLPLLAPVPMDNVLRWDSSSDKDGLMPVVPIFLTQSAFARIHIHSISDMDNEVGGILVGQLCQDPKTGFNFLVIEKALPARYTQHSSIHLTFTQDTIVHYHNIIEQHFPGKYIVGWYHTHPRMSVFLSNYDTWLHNNFFSEPWQVALVVEPFVSLGGFFVRQDGGELDPSRYFGFYEIKGRLGQSSMRWQNLSHSVEKSE